MLMLIMVKHYYNSQPVYRMALHSFMFITWLIVMAGDLEQNIPFCGFWHLMHEMLGIITLFDNISAYYTQCGDSIF